MDELNALRAVDLQWTTHIDRIWESPPYDVPEINAKVRAAVVARLDQLIQSDDPGSPLGAVVTGPGGAGKTHLLAGLREEACRRGAGFVLFDMTDVRDFFETARLGFLRSLFKPVPGEVPQYAWVLQHLLELAGGSARGPSLTVEELASLRPPGLTARCEALLGGLARRFPSEVLEHQDVVRALVLLNSDDWGLQNVGNAWLNGLGIDEQNELRFGFSSAEAGQPEQTCRGLAWAMSLAGPMVLALDQLDAIVVQHDLAAGPTGMQPELAEQRVALSIIEGIGRGLLALRDLTRRTLIVVTCLEGTWHTLQTRTLRSITDRYEPPFLLAEPDRPALLEDLVRRRLDAAHRKTGFSPPYPSWPFRAAAFTTVAAMSPRRALRACAMHVRQCLELGQVVELDRMAEQVDGAIKVAAAEPRVDALAELDREFDALLRAAALPDHLEHDDETRQDRLVESMCDCLVEEHELDGIEADVDHSFVTGKSFDPLHARIRRLDGADGERELHLCVRFIQQSHHRAFQARLKAAITAAGIDRALNFRRLLVLRTTATPTGQVSAGLIEDLQRQGGLLRAPNEADCRTLIALASLRERDDPRLREWLRARRPASKLGCLDGVVSWLFAASEVTIESTAASPPQPAAPSLPAPPAPASDAPPPSAIPASLEPSPSTRPKVAKGSIPPPPRVTPTPAIAPRVAASSSVAVPIGSRMDGGRLGAPVELRLSDLARHVVVLAGSGSGKTVFVRRLVEEVALAGVPSIVIDPANDLARLGDPWPTAQEAHGASDHEKAARYFAQVDVRVWTPGRENGNPITFDPIPDLASLRDDPDEYEVALEMSRTSLEGLLGTGRNTRERSAVLQRALRHLAESGGGGLTRLVEILGDPPPELVAGFARGDALAQELSDKLRAEAEVNRLLRPGASVLDPAALFGRSADGRARVSVVNLLGLPGLALQQTFLDQLASTLFTWVKKNPARTGLRGLLVIDEAKDFVPSGRAVPCRDNLLRLVAQARKYGLGLVFATQEPKSIDHRIVANCTTHVYGKVNSPAAIEVVRELLVQKGGGARGLAELRVGEFFVHSEGFAAPLKTKTRLCLSYHPSAPLDESEVIHRARASRPT